MNCICCAWKCRTVAFRAYSVTAAGTICEHVASGSTNNFPRPTISSILALRHSSKRTLVAHTIIGWSSVYRNVFSSTAVYPLRAGIAIFNHVVSSFLAICAFPVIAYRRLDMYKFSSRTIAPLRAGTKIALICKWSMTAYIALPIWSIGSIGNHVFPCSAVIKGMAHSSSNVCWVPTRSALRALRIRIYCTVQRYVFTA